MKKKMSQTKETIELRRVLNELVNTIEYSPELVTEEEVNQLLEDAREKLGEVQEEIYYAEMEKGESWK